MARNPTPHAAHNATPKPSGATDDTRVFQIPLDRTQRPGMVATLELGARPWS